MDGEVWWKHAKGLSGSVEHKKQINLNFNHEKTRKTNKI